MKPPETVDVGVFEYEIKWDDKLGGFNAAGATNPEMCVILIDPTNNTQVQKETLVHEMLHAAWKQTSLMTRIPDDDRESKGERIIEDLSPLIYAFIRDNREAVRWLQSR